MTMSKYQYFCELCGGVNLTHTADVEWDFKLQTFVVCGTHDDAYCNDCEKDIRGIEMEGESGNQDD